MALGGRVMRKILGHSRDTVTESARAAGHLWRRVSDGNPCAWCAMLVTRGPVYATKDQATRPASRRARGQHRIDPSKYHDFCGCSAEEYVGDPDLWQPTAQEQRYIDLYDQTVERGMDASQAAAAMRAAGQGTIHDATKGTPQGNAAIGKPQRVTEATHAAATLFGLPIRAFDPGVAEDIARTNPHFYDDGPQAAHYKTNCVACVNAYTMRRLGFEVTAAPETTGTGRSTVKTLQMWRDKDGNIRTMTPLVFGNDLVLELERRVEEWPDGAFGWVSVHKTTRDDFAAHVFIVEKDRDLGVVFRDPQGGMMDAYDRFDGQIESIAFARVDDLEPTADVAQFFVPEE